jgi:hypothetical protein
MLYLQGLLGKHMDNDEYISLGRAYMEEVFRIEAKRWPGYLFLSGGAWLSVAIWRLWADGVSVTYLVMLLITAVAFVAGLAVTINDHFERKYFLGQALRRRQDP